MGFHRVPHRRGGRLPDFVRYAGGAFCVRRSPRKGAEKTFVSVCIHTLIRIMVIMELKQ